VTILGILLEKRKMVVEVILGGQQRNQKRRYCMKRAALCLSSAFVALCILSAPLLAKPNMCGNAKPGCGMKCHGDDKIAKCPPKSGAPTAPKVQ